MENFWLCFVPLFVAVDAIGLLPLFISLTEGIDKKKVFKIIIQSVVTALIVALVFLAVGNTILQWLGITVNDFMIAGGILLFIISLRDMLSGDKKRDVIDLDSLGAVPLGVPLIVGPAVLTTTILLTNQYGPLPTIIATFINIILAGAVFFLSSPIYTFLGKAGTKTVSKLANLLLASIAVMLVRKGVVNIILSLK